ncbi:PepSY-associated TM helix domain-containing protein [Kordiimonas pumila]|uniref:PepSY-associated TM helix domain-containing protein n=1 Tax=Kordiimonas pumila TaxID=2161677 RepID=A0ABV7D4D9_9PROT|nr:PepSY-associated TM helix domain-containing protein [Kordiimonas pumila]
MRTIFVYLHRWVGLTIAAFLFVTGLTGAIISWDHELDAWLNPHLVETQTQGTPHPVLEIIQSIEQKYPEMEVLYAPLITEKGHALELFVAPKTNPETGELYPAHFNQIFIDPVSKKELGTRYWGTVWPITTENFVSFLYVLHYSLHIPEMWGIDRWGVWLLGIIALLWTLDCFSGFILTLPRRQRKKPAAQSLKSWWQRWKPAWLIRWRAGGYKLNFDLHRAFSLWTWGLLFVVAFTAFSLNLYREVFYPVMTLVSDVTPSPYDSRIPTADNQYITPLISKAAIIAKAKEQAGTHGWQEPASSIFYARNFGIYRIEFSNPEDGHGAGGVGHKALYFDSSDGRELGSFEPWKGTAADIFVQAQFPVHSGRILGLPGRILISGMGLVIAMLSVTGVIIWLKKRKARNLKKRKTP